ncbi:MAG: response regulator [bacterium]|nr:response regulator [bacterium]
MKTIKGKLLLLQGVLVTVFVVVVVLMHLQETSPVSLLQSDSILRSSNLVKRVMAQHSYAQNAFVYDYSYWDEMVEAVRDRDTVWCRNYLPQGMKTFTTDVAWLCDSSFRVIYSHDLRNQSAATSPLPVPIEEKQRLFASHQFPHFFAFANDQLYEISIGGVQPIGDSLRTSPPQGYFVVGHAWNEQLLMDYSIDAESELTVAAMGAVEGEWESDPSHGIIRFVDTLRDWQGHPIALLRAESFSRSMMEMTNAGSTRLIVLVCLAAVLFGVWWLGLRRLILIPLRQIADALQSESTDPIAKLRDGRDEFGVVARLVKWFFDQREELKKSISDHLVTEGTLHSSLDHLKSISQELNLVLSNATDFIYRQDIYGKLTYLSPSVTEITGYSQDEFKKHYALLLTDHEMNQDVIRNTELALSTGKPVPPYRAEIFHKDRHKLVIEISERPYFEDGKVVGLIGVARDISSVVAHEAEKDRLMLQVQRAERMETLAMLAGGVAHDLNNTLAPLVAYPDLILSSLEENSEIRGEVIEMQTAAKQAAGIVQDLLSMARRGRYQMSPLGLNGMIEKYLQSASFREQIQLHPQVKVKVELDPHAVNVKGSSHHLYTVLMNLVVNAFDAMDTCGTLTITTDASGSIPPQTLMPSPQRTLVRMSISDSGSGIPNDVLNRIFEPYFSTKQVGRSGSGLGLAVVHGIVTDHGGVIEVQSTPGQGTRFNVFLPVTDQVERESRSHAWTDRGTESVLVFDDMADQRRVAAALLKSLGYLVAEAGSMQQALEMVGTNRFDVLVLDMLLDDSYDGLDAHCEIKRVQPHIVTVVVSGFVPTQRVQAIIDSGNAVFLPKPFTGPALGSAIRGLMAEVRISDPAFSAVR